MTHCELVQYGIFCKYFMYDVKIQKRIWKSAKTLFFKDYSIQLGTFFLSEFAIFLNILGYFLFFFQPFFIFLGSGVLGKSRIDFFNHFISVIGNSFFMESGFDILFLGLFELENTF